MKFYKILTYGCQMNVHDSEKIVTMLESAGYTKTEDDNKIDILVFNTCCVRDNAEQKVLGNIGQYKKYKKAKPSMLICVVGCMTQQESSSNNLFKKYHYVDIILGNHNKFELMKAINARLNGSKRIYKRLENDMKAPVCEMPIKRDNSVCAWIDIMYGCNNFCTYCIVPYVRGREQSRDKDLIIKEVKECLDKGFKEITLLGQNVNSYGNDLEGDYKFPDLLEDIAKLDYKFKLNYMTSHPKDFSHRIVEVTKKYPNISRYIHLPLQAGANSVLKSMNRHYTREQYLAIVDDIKTNLPDVGLTTDIMVGFPNETEEDFLETLDIVRKVKYSNAFMFVYSPRVGTPAAEMVQIDDEIKKNRIQRLIAVQREISANDSHSYQNEILEVLCESISQRDSKMVCGRSNNGKLVHFVGDKSLIGQFIKVKITDSASAALIGEIVC